MAVEALLAVHAMLPQLPDPGLIGAGGARALATWAGSAPGMGSRVALACIALLRNTQLFTADFRASD